LDCASKDITHVLSDLLLVRPFWKPVDEGATDHFTNSWQLSQIDNTAPVRSHPVRFLPQQRIARLLLWVRRELTSCPLDFFELELSFPNSPEETGNLIRQFALSAIKERVKSLIGHV
jgi:hypothetical protein